MSIMIGTDIEFLSTVRGLAVPSTDILRDDMEGSKERPIKMEHGVIHRDNIWLEVGAITPASTAEQFSHNVRLALRDAYKYLAVYEAKPLWVPSIHASPKLLEHPESEVFGCKPDYNCWTNKKNTMKQMGNFRSAGGHLHISFEPSESKDDQRIAAIACEAVVGLMSVPYDQNGIERKQRLYGSAGSYRPTKYADRSVGIEYRVPSNWWCSKHSTRVLMFNWAQAAVMHREEIYRRTTGLGDAIQLAINNGNKELSNELLAIMTIDDFVDVA